MKLTALTAVVACCACSAPSSPKDATRLNPGHSPQVATRDIARGLQAHLEFLADDMLEGRGTATRGYDLAARYANSQLLASGAQPAGDDGTYLQTVPLRESRVSKSAFSIVANGKRREFEPAEDFIALPSHRETRQTFSGAVVFAGFGIVSPSFGIDDYKGLDVDGKVVLVLFGAPAQLPSEPRAHYTGPSQKIKAAFDRGATAVIAMHSIQLDKIFPYDAVKEAFVLPQLTWMQGGEGSQATPFIDPPNTGPVAFVSPRVAKALLAGADKDFDEVRRAADANPSTVTGFELPVTVEAEIVSTHKQISSPNVVGVVAGTDPTLRSEHIVVTAHLDHLGLGAPVEGDTIYNGALDNGSGSAMVLELAHYFGAKPPKRSVVFLLVTGEEKGLLGSDYFARNPSVSGPMVANLNLDLVFWTKDTRQLVFFGEGTSTLGAVAREAATRTGFEVIDDPMPEQANFVRSDHYSFVKQGVPALFLGTGFDNDGAAKKHYWANHYHKPSDQLSAVSIDYAMGARLVTMAAEVLTTVANGERRPTWTPGNFFTELYAAP